MTEARLTGFSSTLPVAPGDEGARGIYVHIPFCIVRCPYCDFNAYAGMDELMEPYAAALVREIRAAADHKRVATVFFGGGTPTQLSPERLGGILKAIRDSFALDSDAEITVEANPESVDERVFESLLQSGFNRVSVGVQSLAPSVLARLGRVHTGERALRAARAARAAGFDHLNADLIFGTPGESLAEWRHSLLGVLEEEVDHVSAYALTVEEGTPLAAWVERGVLAAPDEDDQAGKYEAAHELLGTRGFVRYEISNWARPGSWSRHNVNYWQNGDYLGFGAGAHGHRGSRRWWNVKFPRAYIEQSLGVQEGFEELSEDVVIEEAAVLGLRLAGGIDRAGFAGRYGVDPMHRWAKEMRQLQADGLIEVEKERIKLSTRGFLLAGHVARTLVS